MRYRRAPEVLSRTVGAEILLAVAERDGVQQLSGTGRAVWERLDVARSVPELVTLLADVYRGGTAVVADDVRVFVLDLRRRRLVVEVPNDAG
jgi:hypothetical protein